MERLDFSYLLKIPSSIRVFILSPMRGLSVSLCLGVGLGPEPVTVNEGRSEGQRPADSTRKTEKALTSGLPLAGVHPAGLIVRRDTDPPGRCRVERLPRPNKTLFAVWSSRHPPPRAPARHP